jgi:PEP-CTERM motif
LGQPLHTSFDLAPVTITSGAFDTNGLSETFATLDLQGTGIGGAGALVNSAAAVSTITPTGGTTLTGATTIGVTQSTGSLTLNDGISVNVALTKVGTGTLVLNGNPTLNANSSLMVNGGTLRFNVVSGAAAIGTGVTATISSGATLELAGSVSALSSGGNRVSILNTSAAPGVLASGTNQHVGNIDGNGTTQVDAGSDLTANHIIQSALIIGGNAASSGRVTIDASDASGNPLDATQGGPLGQSSGFELAGSLPPSGPFGADGISSADLSSGVGGAADLPVLTPANSALGGNPSSVPEPSSLVLLLLALGGLAAAGRSAARHSLADEFRGFP